MFREPVARITSPSATSAAAPFQDILTDDTSSVAAVSQRGIEDNLLPAFPASDTNRQSDGRHRTSWIAN